MQLGREEEPPVSLGLQAFRWREMNKTSVGMGLSVKSWLIPPLPMSILFQWFSKWGAQIGSISVTWELARKAVLRP